MKNLTSRTLWISSAVGVMLASAASAGTPSSLPQHAKKPTPSIMDSVTTAIVGPDTLPIAQAQKAAAFTEAGQKALAAGRLQEAELCFRSSTELNTYSSAAFAGLAQTLEQEGKGQEAIPVYRYLLYPKKGWGTSMEQDPILRMHFALLLAGDGQWPEAVSVYQSVINAVQIGPAYPRLDIHFSPDTPEPVLLQAMAHLALGVAYNGRLEHAKALSEYDTALSIQPNLAIAHYCHGYGLQRLGRRSEAQADFAKAAALGDGDVKKAAQSPDGLLPR